MSDEKAPAPPAAAPAENLTRNAGIVAAFTLLSRIAGFVRDQVIIHFFGATRTTDVFWMAFTIPNVLRRLVAEGALTVAFVPVYTETREESDVAAKRFLAASFGLVAVGMIGVCGLGMLGAPALVWAFASGFADDPAAFALCVSLTRWLFPYVYFISLMALAMGVLNAHRRFAAPAAAPILLNLTFIGSALFLREAFDPPIFVLVIGVLAGGVAQLLLQIPSLLRAGLLVWPRLDLGSPAIRKLLRLLAPAVFGLAIYQLNIILLRQFASHLPSGQITYYYNADRLIQFAYGVFAIAISTAALPTLSEHYARGRLDDLTATWRSSTNLTNFVTIPATFGLMAVAYPLVSVGYFHGKFTLEDVRMTAATTMAFAPGLVALGAVRATIQVFYAAHDTKTPVLASGVSLVSVLIFGFAFFRYEVVGLGAALTVATWVQLGVLGLLLKRKLQNPTRIEGPSGAHVFIDDKRWRSEMPTREGQTSTTLFLTGLAPGTHSVSFRLAGEEVERRDVEVVAAVSKLRAGRVMLASLRQTALAVVSCAAAYGVTFAGTFDDGPTVKNAAVLFGAMAVAIAMYGGGALLFHFPEAAPVRRKIMSKLKRG